MDRDEKMGREKETGDRKRNSIIEKGQNMKGTRTEERTDRQKKTDRREDRQLATDKKV